MNSNFLRRRSRSLSLACLIVTSGWCATAIAADAPDYSSYHQGTLLTYLSDGDSAHIPKLQIALGDGSDGLHPVVMDTGSTGIVISAQRIPNFDSLPATPGRQVYTSSGRIMVGSIVNVPVTITGDNGNSVQTAPIPVLGVTEIDCLPNARDCEPRSSPRGVAMMGVGFDRTGDAQSSQLANPFLNVSSGQTMRRGYIVTRSGVYIGLTADNTQGNFSYVKLAQNSDADNPWKSATVCITVNHQTPAACGNSLVDTGVDSMFLTLPPAMLGGQATLPSGATLGFSFPGGENGPNAAYYEVTVGQEDTPLSPTSIHVNTTRPTPFVNTGVNFLNGFDVLYDADGGFIAYRPVQ